MGPPVFEPAAAPTPPPPPAFDSGASSPPPPTVRVTAVAPSAAERATGRPSFGTPPAGPPESLPYPSGQSGPTGDVRKRRVWPAIAAVLGALVLLAGGVGVGFVIADRQGDDQPNDAEAVVDEPVSVQEDESSAASNQPVIPVQPGPVSEDEAEPVAAVAAAVAQSVVRIDTSGGTGSGIIYDESGLVVTNAHVVQGATSVSVQLADGTRLDGKVVGSDPAVDVAVVEITGNEGIEDFVPAVFAPTSTVEVGQLAVAIGSPFGLEQSVTAGIISAVSRAIQATNVDDGSPTIVEMVQTDAPINPGNSGGALADRQGRVVGMNTSIRTDGTVQGNLGVGFAIPSDTLLLIAERIVAGESLESGFLGVSGQDPMTGRAGALLTEVVAGGPAEAAGLEVGDLIVAIDGESVAGMTELAAKIRITAPDTEIVVEVVRAGETMDLDVVLGVLGQS